MRILEQNIQIPIEVKVNQIHRDGSVFEGIGQHGVGVGISGDELTHYRAYGFVFAKGEGSSGSQFNRGGIFHFIKEYDRENLFRRGSFFIFCLYS